MLDGVDLLEQGFLVFPLEHRQHRAEDFLVGDAHFLRHVGEHGRFDEKAAGKLRVAGPPAAAG
ncbi:hypothetical protein D3C83_115530 [compost metagenome]